MTFPRCPLDASGQARRPRTYGDGSGCAGCGVAPVIVGDAGRSSCIRAPRMRALFALLAAHPRCCPPPRRLGTEWGLRTQRAVAGIWSLEPRESVEEARTQAPVAGHTSRSGHDLWPAHQARAAESKARAQSRKACRACSADPRRGVLGPARSGAAPRRSPHPPHRRHRRVGRRPRGARAVPQARAARTAAWRFVVVQHLDPTHKGAMVELLQRVEPHAGRAGQGPAEGRARPRLRDPAEQGHVDPARRAPPPAADRRRAASTCPSTSSSARSPTTSRSAASASILSGMGSDGTLGLRAIKEKAGAAFVQSLASAKFDGMPRSAIECRAGRRRGPRRRAAARRSSPTSSTRRTAVRPETRSSGEAAQRAREDLHPAARAHGQRLLPLQAQHDLPPHRAAHGPAPDRQDRQLRALPAGEPARGRAALQGAAHRRDELLPRSARRGSTCSEVLPDLLRSRPAGGVLRAWVPGCSTGEEAYSLAIVLTEAIEKLGRPPTSRFADLRHRPRPRRDRAGAPRASIRPTSPPTSPPSACAGSSPRTSAATASARRSASSWCSLRRTSSWIRPSPSSTSCRAATFSSTSRAELQKKLIPLFHYALNPGGVLFLGSAETIGTYSVALRARSTAEDAPLPAAPSHAGRGRRRVPARAAQPRRPRASPLDEAKPPELARSPPGEPADRSPIA